MIYACPFSYVGSKSKLLPELLPLLSNEPDRIFVDLFGGGFSVGLNVANRSVIYNDVNSDLVSLIRLIKDSPFDEFNGRLADRIDYYELSKTNRDGYIRLRTDFNNSQDPLLFGLLIFYSFNHQIRYNGSLKFNTPFGTNRSSYNARTQKNLQNFARIIKTKDVTFLSGDFRDVDIPKNATVYLDPPYLITTGSYNDGNRGVSSWNESSEQELYRYIDQLDNKGIPFALSNMLKKGDSINMLLDGWRKKYSTISVASQYRNYQRKDYKTEEVIITNMPHQGQNRD